MSGAVAVLINRMDGSQVRLTREDRIASPHGAVPFDAVPRVLAEDGSWIEYEDTAQDAGAEEWMGAESCPTRIRLYARGVIDTMVLFTEAA